MPRPPFITGYLPEPGTAEAGPITGMCDSVSPTAGSANKARFMGNLFRGTGPAGESINQRPGFRSLGASVGSLVQVAASTWTLYNGVRLTFQVCDGQVWTLNGDGAWELALSAAQLAAAGCPLSPVAQVAAVPFADRLILSDGVNYVGWWDGTVGGGLVSVPVVLKGVPTVYASKCFGILANSPTTMGWCEEGDLSKGWGLTVAGLIYDYLWDNPGGLSEPLEALKGRNEGLFVLRARSALGLYGAVNEDFQTAHTLADMSTTVGTMSPWAVVNVDGGIVAPDADGVPQFFRMGQPPVAVGGSYDYLETVRATPKGVLRYALGGYDPATNCVLLGLPVAGQTYASQWLAFHGTDGQFGGVWAWGADGARECSSMGLIIDTEGNARWTHADLVAGRNYVHGDLLNGPFSDEEGTETFPITSLFQGPKLGYDLERTFFVNSAHGGFSSGVSALDIWVETSDSPGVPLHWTSDNDDGAFMVDESEVDGDDLLGGEETLAQATVGYTTRGRWASYCWRHSVLDEPLAHDVHRLGIGYTQGHPRAA